jgi:hypothetical protein
LENGNFDQILAIWAEENYDNIGLKENPHVPAKRWRFELFASPSTHLNIYQTYHMFIT